MTAGGPSAAPPAQIGLGAGLVPPGSLALRDAVWGIDPSTKRIAVGGIAGGERLPWAEIRSLRQGHDHERLHAAATELVGWFPKLMLEHAQIPGLVVVEQPFSSGRHVPHASLHMVGVIQVAIWHTWGVKAELMFLNPGEWKLRALGAGHGAAKKPEILRWAREVCGLEAGCVFCGDGLEPMTAEQAAKRKAWKVGDCPDPGPAHDLADALGIATAGGVIVAGRS